MHKNRIRLTFVRFEIPNRSQLGVLSYPFSYIWWPRVVFSTISTSDLKLKLQWASKGAKIDHNVS